MAYTIVIKVQHRDILRRFNAKVDENYKLDIDLDGLRAKISRLFGFSAYADLTLTYIDEDGDEVALIDDAELRDVMNQELDFLMIHVVLNGEKWDKLPTTSSERRTPLRYPRRPPTLPGLSSACAAAIAELLKSLPVPLLEELSKLALDSVTKAASPTPLKMVRDVGSKDATSTRSNASEDGNKIELVPKSATKLKMEQEMEPIVSKFGAPPREKYPPVFPLFGELQPRRTPLDGNSKREEPVQIHNNKPATPSSNANFSSSYVPAFRCPSFSQRPFFTFPPQSSLFQPSPFGPQEELVSSSGTRSKIAQEVEPVVSIFGAPVHDKSPPVFPPFGSASKFVYRCGQSGF